jgi:hypothetical protein
MPTSAQTVQDFIAAFMKAWPTADHAALRPFFDEDAIFHSVPF